MGLEILGKSVFLKEVKEYVLHEKHEAIRFEHILYLLMNKEEIKQLFRKLSKASVPSEIQGMAKASLSENLMASNLVDEDNILVSKEAQDIIKKLEMVSSLETLNFLYTIINTHKVSSSWFLKVQVSLADIQAFLAISANKEELEAFGKKTSIKEKKMQKIGSGEDTGEFNIDDYLICIQDERAEKKSDKVIGRDQEVERVLEVLAKRKKSTPIILGLPGVGKTAVVEAICDQANEGKLTSMIGERKIYSLETSKLLAGTKFRGELEERIEKLLSYLKEHASEMVIFIDEIHSFLGVGKGENGGMGVANMLKPELARGTLKVIGATTFKEYKLIEEDPALKRRFQKVVINPPSIEDTIKILSGVKDGYEKHHLVSYSEEAIKAICTYADQYLKEENFPDKAIDLMDEAGVYTKKAGKKIVEKDDIIRVVAKMTNLKIEDLSMNLKEKVKLIESKLSSNIIGQEGAVEALTRAIKISFSRIDKQEKPIGSFLFVGPSGVGKTELAIQLEKSLGHKLQRFDMSEYREEHSVTKLIGAPPGYTGYTEGGKLLELVKANPQSILLFDEVEKAHKSIFNILLQVMDYGFLSDNQGNKIDFRNTIIILTSNLGAEIFYSSEEGKSGNLSPEFLKTAEESIDKSVSGFFAPEFLNRLTKKVIFLPLNEIAVQKIIRLKFEKIINSVKENCEISLTISKECYSLVAKNIKSQSSTNGRSIEKMITPMKDLLTDYLFDSNYLVKNILVSVKEDGYIFSEIKENGLDNLSHFSQVS